MATYLITGASQGIGFQLVLTLLQQNHTVYALARNSKKLALLAERGAHIISCDISDSADVEKFAKHVDDVVFDGLVNNAGMLINKPFLNLTEEDWLNSFQVNVFGPVRLIKTMNFSNNSHIVNISSMGGFQGSSKYPGLSAYSASKGALSTLTECLAGELETVSVNCLCLGAVQTEMLSEAFPDYNAPVQSDEMATYIADFLQNGHRFFNGKLIPVALSNP